ncbi:hypothetical protein BYT27DRAFT_7215798 [Phlegmacium glaucopus]|nr:hypothetical protein BYT27DRAFT_7215798 [Phlegmacium glaucopus]
MDPRRICNCCQPDDQRYVVPAFMVPAMHQLFDGHRKKEDLKAFGASGSIHEFNKELFDKQLFDIIGKGKLMAPTLPGSSDRECLSAHSEVLALQERLGILYKDAAHCLYMAELEGVKAQQNMYKAFTSLQGSMEKTLKMAYNTVKVIGTTGPCAGASTNVEGDVEEHI